MGSLADQYISDSTTSSNSEVIKELGARLEVFDQVCDEIFTFLVSDRTLSDANQNKEHNRNVLKARAITNKPISDLSLPDTLQRLREQVKEAAYIKSSIERFKADVSQIPP